MERCIMCFTSLEGLPILIRNQENYSSEKLSFSTATSFKGAHMFCQSQEIELMSTHTDDWTLVWQDYDNIMTIISAAAGKDVSEKNLRTLSYFAYNTFLLFINAEDFKSLQNFERIRQEVKRYTPIIDNLLDNFDMELLEFSDCILISEYIQILLKLNEFCNQIGTPFCSVIIHEKLAVGTYGWWDLSVTDRKLLLTLLNTQKLPLIDIPIYLSKRNSDIAYRFVTIPILDNVKICSICGIEPSYEKIHKYAYKIWLNDSEILQNAAAATVTKHCLLRNFPHSIEIDSNILGFLIINQHKRKYLISRNLQQSTGRGSMSGSHRLYILRLFYYQSINATMKTFNIQRIFKKNKNRIEQETAENMRFNSDLVESYWCSEYHKCYSLADDRGSILCALFNVSTTSYTMRLIIHETFKLLICNNIIYW